MTLSNLPVEILDLVCQHLYDDPGDGYPPCAPSLLHAALSCACLRDISRPWIFREVKFCHPSNRADRLLRTLREKPSYGKFVHHAVVWNRESDENTIYTGSKDELSYMFSTMSNLRDLYAPLFPPEVVGAMLLVSNTAFRDTLEYFCINGSKLNVFQLFELLSYPQLLHVTLFAFQDIDCCPCDRLPHLLPLRLVSLTLESCQIGFPMLEAIVGKSTNLEVLDVPLPLPCPSRRTSDRGGVMTGPGVSISLPMSMRPLSDLLTRFTHSLTELTLRKFRQSWNGHDKSRLDLQHFNVLRSASLADGCFFPCSTVGRDRQGFTSLLPESLENLEIKWGTESGIFFSTSPFSDEHERTMETFHRGNEQGTTDDEWIRELAVQKSRSLSNLQTVSFDEDMVFPDTGAIFGLRDWEQPSNIRDAFLMAGIKLNVAFRAARVLRRPT